MAEDELINQNVLIEEDGNDIEIEETVDVIDVTDSESLTVDSLDAFPALGETNEELKHQLLNGRELPDQHPITSITGLREELDAIEALDSVYSDKRNQADYYLWEDENILQENRIGYFVSACSDINKIKMCTSENDIFGVTVDGAGFVGAQDDIARDIKYGLVVTTGVVHVRCEQPVEVGDYVVSNDYGYAQKNKNGYKVVGRHLIDGVEYAEITLVTPIGRMCELTEDVENLNDRMDDAEANIAAAMNVANAAYNKAGGSIIIAENASKDASDAVTKADNAVTNTEQFGERVARANEIAVQAKAISESASVAAERIRTEAVSTANSALTEVNNTQNELNELIGDMNPLITWEGENGSGIGGFVSQVEADRVILAELSEWNDDEGGTQSLAGIISTVGKHEAILEGFVGYDGEMKETIAHVEQKADANGASITSLVSSVDKYSVGEYSQAYGLTREQAASILKPGYIYIPTKHSNTKVSHEEIFVGETEINEFTPGDYYVWGINDQGSADWIEHSVGKVWISNAIPANSNDLLQYWYIDSNEAPQNYEAYALYIWEDNKWKKVNTLAGNASNRAVSMIRQATNEIAAEVTNTRGELAALSLTVDDNKNTQAALIAKVVKDDGTVNTASIISAVNESESSVAITADHIVLNGYTSNANGSFQIDTGGYMIATGGVIGSWRIQEGYLQGYTDENNYVNMWAPGASNNTNGNFINVRSDGAYPFILKADGTLTATKATITGTITANDGTIGGWTIGANDLYVGDSYSDAPMGMGTSSANWAFWAGMTRNSEGTAIANFRVTADGYLYAKAGQIGGWTMSSQGLFSGSDYNAAKVGMSANYASDNSAVFWAGYTSGSGSAFRVSADGTLLAKKANITGTITAESGSFKGTLQVGSKLFNNNSISLFQDSGGNGLRHEVGNYTHQISFSSTNLHLESKMGSYRTYITLHPHSNSLSPGDSGWQASLILGVAGTGQYGLLAGNWQVGSLTSSTAVTSDVNLKNTVQAMDEKYERFFDDIEPITYKYNDSESDRTHTGYIAQQIGASLTKNGLTNQDFAGLVITNYNLSEDEPPRWCLRYEEFVSLNTWQIQKAKTRIADLENRVEQLEKLLGEKGEN